MYIRTENLPILQDFVPYRGRCPKRVLIDKNHGLPIYIFDNLQHLKYLLLHLNLFLCHIFIALFSSLVSCFVIVHAVVEYAHHT